MRITYTDGSYTDFGYCFCKQTACNCGSIKHYPKVIQHTEIVKPIPIEEIWKITERLPSLSKMLSDDRDCK